MVRMQEPKLQRDRGSASASQNPRLPRQFEYKVSHPFYRCGDQGPGEMVKGRVSRQRRELEASQGYVLGPLLDHLPNKAGRVNTPIVCDRPRMRQGLTFGPGPTLRQVPERPNETPVTTQDHSRMGVGHTFGPQASQPRGGLGREPHKGPD